MQDKVNVLGDVRVTRSDELVPLGGAMPRRLLAALAVDTPRAVPTASLIERLWGDNPPSTARTALQVHISRLRRALEPDHLDGEPWTVIVSVDGGYALRADHRSIDAARYEDLIADAERLAAYDANAALRRLDTASALWHGQPWGDLADEPWLGADAARLEDLHRRAEELWGEVQLSLGRHESSLERLRTAVADEPLRDRRWEQLMLALYRSGRQADALGAFQDARRVFVDDLGIEPGPSLRELERGILDQDSRLDAPVVRASHDEPHHNLPLALTPLLGRTEDVQTVEKMLASSRLVNVTGPGGCGKTRLALEVAEVLCDQEPDGAWFVELAAARTPDLAAAHIASALGLRESDEHSTGSALDVVTAYLRRRELLLVIDNCEHLAAEVAGIAGALLTSCPGLKVLVTSRVALGVVGEACHALAPLETPSDDASLDDIAASPAVRLFLERADDVGSQTVRDREQLGAIAALCRFLDGLPLAIEMAALSMRTLSPAELLERLDRRLALAGDTGHDQQSSRHRALRATIDWGHALLTEPEQRAFRRLSVFAAGCTLAGAEAVVADEAVHQPDAVVGLVNRLVVASLLRPDQRTTPRRYQMLDTIREYADERLAESGETELARARQLDYFVGLAMQVRIEERLGPQPRQLMTLLDAEHDNIREALQRLLDDEDGEAALRLASAMGTYWNERGYWGEGRRWLLRALDLTKGARTLDRARGLLALAETTSSFAGIAAATPQLEESIAICREHDHPMLLGITLLYLSNAHGWNHDQAARDIAFTEAKEISATVGGWWVQAGFDVYSSLGRVLDGEFEEAHRGLVAAADSLVRNGDDSYAARTLMYAGNVARMMGDLPSARDDLERSIDLSEADIVRGTRAHSALTLAQISLELGDPEAPARFSECMAELERIGDERCLATCLRTLGSLALDDGRPDDALAYFRSGLDGLALHDQRSLAVALGDIARIEAERGDTDAAATLATAARVYAERSGSPLTNAETDRLAAVTRTYGNGSDEVDLEAALELARHAG